MSSVVHGSPFDQNRPLRKCRVHWETTGPRYEQIRKMATRGTRQFPGKAAVVCYVEEVYQGSGGDGAGKKLV